MKPVAVSQLNRYIKTVLQNDPVLTDVWVAGEISNLKYHSSGHVYFSLKDKTSTIRCFLSESKAVYLDYLLEEGMAVIARAYIYLYEKGGYYSLNIVEISPEGEGSIAAAFEKLKKKLQAEGIFDQAHKKALPAFPESVGICTSQTGAALWDMIRTIKNKNNYVNIKICPCAVQGEGASEDIARAIRALENSVNPPDVIIVGRGGGSMEDLWAFNEEPAVRAVYSCSIPVISAVGHETDFTITDFTADYRAATPTAAAEAAVPDLRELEAEMAFTVDEARRRLELRLDSLESRVRSLSPFDLMRVLENKLMLMESRTENLYRAAASAMGNIIQREELKLEKIKTAAEALNPEHIMSLGYGAVMKSDGSLVKGVDAVVPGDELSIRLADGIIKADCRDIRKY